jgi:molybdate-binding protein
MEHLANKRVRFVNREAGSGARALADRLMRQADVAASRVRGYQAEAYGHLAAAYAVLAGDADCCIATRSAAQAFGLDFIPLKSERYDLVMRRQTLQLPALQSFLDVLQRATLRRQLEVFAGYDTRQTGTVLA